MFNVLPLTTSTVTDPSGLLFLSVMLTPEPAFKETALLNVTDTGADGSTLLSPGFGDWLRTVVGVSPGPFPCVFPVTRMSLIRLEPVLPMPWLPLVFVFELTTQRIYSRSRSLAAA